MNNNQRRIIKKYIKSVVQDNTNNTVISTKVISSEHVECTCSNKFSEEHIITVILGVKANYIMYDGGVIKVDYAKMSKVQREV